MNAFLKYLMDKLRDRQPDAVVTVDDQPYALKADGTLGEPIRELMPQWTAPTLQLRSLDALMSVYLLGLDDSELEPTAAIHVVDYNLVEMINIVADEYGRRHVWAQVRHNNDTPFAFDYYYATPEEFIIAFRASFHFNDNAVTVLKLVSNLSAENSVTIADDGYSQRTTINTGVINRELATLPSEIPLIPWRTFREVNPVESKFMLRMKSVQGKAPQVALFEIDAKWKLDTVAAIRKYLSAGQPDLHILA